MSERPSAGCFQAFVREQAQAVESALLELLPSAQDQPVRLHEAMHYAMFPGGKRLRPMLTLLGCAATGGGLQAALRPGAALECLHTYSLVHDDLPAMDDAETRRGQPSVHRQFDEATAILAGDQLLTYALGHLADEPTALRALSGAAAQMVRGQMLDLLSESDAVSLDLPALERLQAQKTGAIIRFACEAPALLMGSEAAAQALGDYGHHLGLAFQITDDLLDAVSDPETLGKPVGADALAGKATFVTLLGVDAARARAAQEISAARAALSGLDGHINDNGAALAFLSSLAEFVLTRHH